MLASVLKSGRALTARQVQLESVNGGILKYRVVIEQDEDGMFVVECPSLPGCVSQGRTRAEALANIADAIQGYLVSLAKHGEPVPPAITEEVVEVAV